MLSPMQAAANGLGSADRPPPPLPPIVYPSATPSPTTTDIWLSEADEALVSMIPKPYNRPVRALLQHVKQSPALKYQPKSGHMAYMGEKIPGANIVDYMNHLLRPPQQVGLPSEKTKEGIDLVLCGLSQTPFPEAYVKLQDFIDRLHMYQKCTDIRQQQYDHLAAQKEWELGSSTDLIQYRMDQPHQSLPQ